ncbi:MAG: tetratricopeptide repeat protein [Magnetococcales bacterium]|nr:tetratricopeptide repeat protein [Magnetococcales bacterium]
MSQIIEKLNNMESFRNAISHTDGVAQNEQVTDATNGDQPQSIPRARRTVLGRAAGWSLVALLITGAGVAANNIWPTAFATSSLFKESSASEVRAKRGTVSIISNPSKVGVLMDGQFVGITPLKFDWLVGSHRLVLKLNGYHDVVTIVNVKEGQEQNLDLFLFPVGEDKQAEVSARAINKIEPKNGPQDVAKKVVAKPRMISPKSDIPQVVIPDILQPKAKMPASSQMMVAEPEKIKKVEVKKVTKRKSEKKKFNRKGAPPRALSYIKNGTNLLDSTDGATELKYKYTIQVGAFLSRDSALAYAHSWKKKGYDAYILELYGVKDPSKLWQSVRIGHFNDLERAREARNAFNAWENIYSYVALWDSFNGPDGGESTAVIKKALPKKAVVKKAVAKKAVVKKAVAKKAVAKKVVAKKVVAKKAVTENKAKKVVAKKAVDEKRYLKPKKEMVTAITSVAANKPYTFEPEESAAYAVVNSPMPSKTPQQMKKAVEAVPEKTELAAVNDFSLPASAMKPPSRSKDIASPPVMLVKPSSGEIEGMFSRSAKLRDQGKTQEAVELLKNILQAKPEHGRARRRLARIYVESGQANKALVLLQGGVAGRSTLQLSKEEPNLAAFLAALYQRDEDHWHAIDLYENLLRRFPDKGVWQMGLAISLERVGEPEDALKAYKTALNSGDLSHRLRTFVNKRVEELQ